VNEKTVLPSAEDLKLEKVHEGLIKGVEAFSPENLKPTKTREPASATEGNFKCTVQSQLLAMVNAPLFKNTAILAYQPSDNLINRHIYFYIIKISFKIFYDPFN